MKRVKPEVVKIKRLKPGSDACMPGYKPKILEASSLAIHPESTVLEVSFEALVEMAERYTVELFELPDRFIIVYPGIVWYAKKEKRRKFER